MSSNKFKHALREYFTFTQSELRGTIALLVIIGFLVALRWTLPFFHKGKLNRLNAVHIESPDSLIAAASPQMRRDSSNTNPNRAGDFNIAEVEIEKSKFAFDPNTASFPDLMRLGFSRKVSNNIIRYRNKGGKFRSANDMLKLYGVDTNLVFELEPYMMLPEVTVAASRSSDNYNPVATAAEKETVSTFKTVNTSVAKNQVDINTADSATLVTARGIGPVFASRIIKLRNRLGGFVSKEQLKDVYGMTPENFEIIEPSVTIQPVAVKKLNINTATIDELKLHAYFNYKTAKAVIAYRDAHNGFKTIDELKNVEQLDDAFIAKNKPYIAVE